MSTVSGARDEMVARQIAGRGVRSPRVLAAMRRVPRERFLPPDLAEFAYHDTPLPIAAGQTISQPYIVALMVEALDLAPDARVLEIGTGSGYAAAVLAEVAAEVFTIERFAELARSAEAALRDTGYGDVHVRVGDGTLGWPEAAPFDGIVVAAGGPVVPPALQRQLAIGGRLVIPVGTRDAQTLTRITRTGPDQFTEERLGSVRFVPLTGIQGWQERGGPGRRALPGERSLQREIRVAAERIEPGAPALDGLLERVGDASVVLLGEATHGTHEFYAMRAAITRRLVEERRVSVIALEADWPDAARIDHHVRDRDVDVPDWLPFARFPTWMWRNEPFAELVAWLRAHNLQREPADRVRVIGLDLYSLYTSIGQVVRYLEGVDPDTARLARERYGCLTPWQKDPATYGRMASTDTFHSCEAPVVAMLKELLSERVAQLATDPEQHLDATQNALLIANAERYYRAMYRGSVTSWNLRDTHMMQTLDRVRGFVGQGGVVVWAHNSHLGDARATELGARGEINLGQLCRQRYPGDVYSLGFGTHTGTVAAASTWDGPMEIKTVRPSLEESHGWVLHGADVPAYLLPLRDGPPVVREGMAEVRLHRAIGVIYRPETERGSHYFDSRLAEQFDEVAWLDRTTAVRALEVAGGTGSPDTWPFGL